MPKNKRYHVFKKPFPKRNKNKHQEMLDFSFPLTPTRPTFYCCPCERGFKTQEMLNNHNKEHMICGLEGCTFEAHGLVVQKHIRMQHEGNLFQRMKNVKTPEEIQAWKRERLRNFPTLAKQEEDRKKKERMGRVIKNPFPKIEFRYTLQQQERAKQTFYDYWRKMKWIERQQSDDWMNRTFAPDPKKRHVRVPFFSMNTSEIVTMENFYLNVKYDRKDGKIKRQTKVKWRGVLAKKLDRLPDSESEEEADGLPISDDENDYANSASTSDTVKPVPGTSSNENSAKLGMLVGYDCSSDSESEDNPTSSSVRKDFADTSDTDNDNGCASSDESITIDEFKVDQTFKEKRIFTTDGGMPKRKRWRPDLLEMLLQDEIQKERHTLLQACQYISDNNYFKS